ncbi:hypothetical protein [Actinomadura miaoliensis]|uniref:Uncharacterized protein n=1 Tax=Actinomadura miaoliensis TaxID=430685 RepID=A0ABP7WBZ3_9ACTN
MPKMTPRQLGDRLELAAAMMTPEAIADFQAAAARLDDRHSLHNKFAIWVQKPDASQVFGMMTWREHGRKVARGQGGIAIFAPVTRREASDGDDNDQAATRRRSGADNGKDGGKDGTAGQGRRIRKGYRISYVWDISQTVPVDCQCPADAPCACPQPKPPAPAGTKPDDADVRELMEALTADDDSQE